MRCKGTTRVGKTHQTFDERIILIELRRAPCRVIVHRTLLNPTGWLWLLRRPGPAFLSSPTQTR